VAGIPELVTPDCGLLIPEKSSEDLAGALEKLIKDVKLRAEMGKRGRNIVRKQFDLTKSAAALGRLFVDRL
jgi:glycosyltransferase involved in cell wall biosynthesis